MQEEDPFEALAKMILLHNQQRANRGKPTVIDDSDDEECSETGIETSPTQTTKDVPKITFGPVPTQSSKSPAPFFINTKSKAVPLPGASSLTGSRSTGSTSTGSPSTGASLSARNVVAKKSTPPAARGGRKSRASSTTHTAKDQIPVAKKRKLRNEKADEEDEIAQDNKGTPSEGEEPHE